MTASDQPLAVVTGTSSGMGLSLAAELAARGFDLLMLNRSETRSAAVLRAVEKARPGTVAEIVRVDLSSQEAVNHAAAVVLTRTAGVGIDLLVNNAGVMPERLETTVDGIDLTCQVNLLAPYMLIRLLEPALAAAKGTVLNVSSGTIYMTWPLRVDRLAEPGKLIRGFGAYAQSKLALATLTEAMAPVLARKGIASRSMSPGAVATGMTAGKGMPAGTRFFRPLFKTPERGAWEMAEAALSPDFGHVSGGFIAGGGRHWRLPKSARDPETQHRLLEFCREQTGL